MHTLRDYLRKNEKRIIAVNGFIAAENGEDMIPCKCETSQILKDVFHIVTPWSITFYDYWGDPKIRFKLEGASLTDIDTPLSEKDVDEGESVIVGKVARSQENILQIVEDEGRTIVIEKPIKMIDDGEYIAEDVYGHKIVLEAV